MLTRVKPSLFISLVVVTSLIGCSDDAPGTAVVTDSGEFAEVITTRPDDGPDTNAPDTATSDTAMGDTAMGETGGETGTDAGSVTTVTATGVSFMPANVTIKVGQKVRWVMAAGMHTVTSGTACTADGKFCNPADTSCAGAPVMGPGATYERTFATAGDFPYFCAPHCLAGMTGKVTVTP